MKDESSKSRTRLSPGVRLPQPSIERKGREHHELTLAFEPILRGMCFNPDSLTLEDEMRGGSLVLMIRPHAADYGILCGTRGRQINSINCLFRTACARAGIDGKVELEQTFIGERGEPVPFVPNSKFDVEEFRGIFERVLQVVFGEVSKAVMMIRDEKLKVYVTPRPDHFGDPTLISALADLSYPYGWKKGRRIEIREISKMVHTESETSKHENKPGKTSVSD